MFVEHKSDGEVQIGVLRDAEDLLRKDGWTRGNPIKRGLSKHCLGQALALAAFKYGISYHEVQKPMLRAAAIQTGREWRDIPQYNDALERSVEDVWDLFRIAENL